MYNYYSYIIIGNAMMSLEGSTSPDMDVGDSIKTIHISTYSSALREISQAIADAENENFIKIILGNSNCREQLLETSEVILDACVKSPGTYYGPVIFVELDGVSPSLEKNLLEFCNEFFSGLNSNQYYIAKRNGKLVFSMRINTANISHSLYTMSFFLRIFKTDVVPIACMENVKDRNIDSLFLFLSRMYLSNPDWGSKQNSNLRMSLFAYNCYRKSCLPKGYSGPVGASSQSNINVMMDFASEVYKREFPHDMEYNAARFPHELADTSLELGLRKLLPLVYGNFSHSVHGSEQNAEHGNSEVKLPIGEPI